MSFLGVELVGRDLFSVEKPFGVIAPELLGDVTMLVDELGVSRRLGRVISDRS